MPEELNLRKRVGWGIVEIRETTENAPRFQRSGKTVEGVCVVGGDDARVGAGVGFCAARRGDGMLRWSDVSAAWAYAEEDFE